MSALNESQERHLVATFSHVDQLLQDVERLARADLTPFAHERPDLSSDDTRLLLSFVDRARTRMLGALDRLGIPRPAPTVSARWGIETALRFAEIALSELRSEHLAAYGSVDEMAAAEVSALASDLRSVMRRGRALLHERDAGGLADQVSRLSGHAGTILRALERLSAEHGLAEVRALIAPVIERATATTLDVGVFGRVGAGKSSLVNLFIGTPALPIGATPVTAVPVRIQRGPAGATVDLYEDGARRIPLEEIATYVTEEHNPRNRLGVRAVDVAVPTAPAGLRLLDTPGVGSLATSGPAQAFAWLPRCDLGLVLIQAGSPWGREELALVAGLFHVGIACRVLISKADLLGEDEVDRARAYIAGEVAASLGDAQSIEVRLVSTQPGFSTQLDSFRREVLEPLAGEHAQHGKQALRRRLHRLVAVTAAELAGRRPGGDDRVVALAQAHLEGAKAIEQATYRLANATATVLDAAARAVADAWARGEAAPRAVRQVILDTAGQALAAVRAALASGRGATESSPDAETWRLPPLFEPELLDRLPALVPPPFGGRLWGPALAARALRPLAAPLTAALERYAERLRAWGLAQLDEVTAASEVPVSVVTPPLTGELAELDALIDQPEPRT